MYLVIVESPAKARTISKFLGKKYKVKASIGHLIDLPRSQLGIDLENNFKPKYITIRGKGKILQELRTASKKAERVYLATDPDREGEAISWHLSNSLKLNNSEPCRVEFHEITKTAVKNAFAKPRYLNLDKIEAQQARRILDRLVGYTISPLLWEKVRKGLSAGRVQSVALRLICDREREIEAFVKEEYWTIDGDFKELAQGNTFTARFHSQQGKKINLATEKEVAGILKGLKDQNYVVQKVRLQQRRRNPAAPFTTSTLQQEASRKLRFTTKKTMMIAQQLYEGIKVGQKGEAEGLITYMRTDATTVSPQAQKEAREYIGLKYGEKYLPAKPRKFAVSKSAQEAHEAIRPTAILKEPSVIKNFLSRDQQRLYKLIWERFLASQMAAALIEQVRADILAGEYLFRASGSSVKFSGFMEIYTEGKDEETEKDKEKQLPHLEEGQQLKLLKLNPEQHFTQPPPRFSEASLVKAMENKGIGRPSTYSPTIETILSRGYVLKEDRVFKPAELGFIIADLLKSYFPEIVDINFTAQLENKLDRVEAGEISRQKVLSDFYAPFKNRLDVAKKEMKKIKIKDEETDKICPLCGKNLVKKFGRYGQFLACPGFPECRHTEQLKVEIGVKCPSCEGMVIERRSKKGRKFFGCTRFPECKFVSWDKPIEKKCPQCGAYMVEKNYRRPPYKVLLCANKECGFRENEPAQNKNAGESQP
ncbi:MAG: type I DNA topoisomerase [Firmicutes bacterium]|nr:type I DNA topoisomerase [Bacillota bacterium]